MLIILLIRYVYPISQQPIDEDDEEEAVDGAASYDKTIMPEFVVTLEATDDFLKNRVMNLPEAVVTGTHNTEKELLRRLTDFRAANSEDDTVLNYFDELEFHPEKIGVFLSQFPFNVN